MRLAGMGVGNVSLTGLGEEARRGIADTLEKVHAKMPLARGAVSGIGTEALPLEEYARHYPDTGKIALSKSLFANVQKLRKSYDEAVAGRFHPAGTDYRSIFTHEVGHAVVSKIAQSLRLTPRRLCDIMRDNVLKESGMNWWSIEFGLSGYAQTNSVEFIAEAFAEYVDSVSPRKLAELVGEKLKTYLMRIK